MGGPVSDTSDSFSGKAIFRDFCKKMDPWSWTPTNPENFKARRTGFSASRHGWGGWGGGASENSLWRRDLSVLEGRGELYPVDPRYEYRKQPSNLPVGF